jgi:hypothetical protein
MFPLLLCDSVFKEYGCLLPTIRILSLVHYREPFLRSGNRRFLFFRIPGCGNSSRKQKTKANQYCDSQNHIRPPSNESGFITASPRDKSILLIKLLPRGLTILTDTQEISVVQTIPGA